MDGGDFTKTFGFHKPDHKQKLVFYCKTGKRSASALSLAKSKGFTNVRNYTGSWADVSVCVCVWVVGGEGGGSVCDDVSGVVQWERVLGGPRHERKADCGLHTVFDSLTLLTVVKPRAEGRLSATPTHSLISTWCVVRSPHTVHFH